MSDIQLDLIYGSNEPEVQAGPSCSLDEASGQLTDSSEESARDQEERTSFWKTAARKLKPFVLNFKALFSRFIQLAYRPADLAPIILDFLTLSLSIIWTDRQPGPDLLYPLSSLVKQKSGRLARPLLEHSRDLQLKNLHVAASPQDGIDPPRVAVIDLDEVPQEIIERGYTVSADFYGFMVMTVFLEILISPIVYIFLPIDTTPYLEWASGLVTTLFGDWIGGRYAFFAGIVFSGAVLQWINTISAISATCTYAAFHGEGTLTLVRRSDVSTPSCAALLDRDFTLVLRGTQNVVEAIAESSFSMSHALASRHRLERWQFGQCLCYEAFKASCQGAPLTILTGGWLLLGPTSHLMAFAPLVPTLAISLWIAYTRAIRPYSQDHTVQEDVDSNGSLNLPPPFLAIVILVFSIAPTFLLILIYELAIVKDPLLRSFIQPAIWLHFVPEILLIIQRISSQNYHIRTTKLLDILGSPPIRRWEFDTLAAAATFQCLILCHGISRPIRKLDVLALMDTFIPDQTDIWKVWKARVADRIAHENDVSFAPTLPSFGDHRQKRLKELLDQAQIGYGAYTEFYEWHVPMYSTIAL